MDSKEQTRIFWTNLDNLKKSRGMTWEDLEAETGHSARSIATMKAMNKAPSFHFALSLAAALGTSIESLASKEPCKPGQEGSMKDVLYRICDSLDENEIFMLTCTAESIKESKQEYGFRNIDDAMEKMKQRYL